MSNPSDLFERLGAVVPADVAEWMTRNRETVEALIKQATPAITAEAVAAEKRGPYTSSNVLRHPKGAGYEEQLAVQEGYADERAPADALLLPNEDNYTHTGVAKKFLGVWHVGIDSDYGPSTPPNEYGTVKKVWEVWRRASPEEAALAQADADKGRRNEEKLAAKHAADKALYEKYKDEAARWSGVAASTRQGRGRSTISSATEAEQAAWPQKTPAKELEIGQRVYLHAQGATRRGIVVGIGKTRARVLYRNLTAGYDRQGTWYIKSTKDVSADLIYDGARA